MEEALLTLAVPCENIMGEPPGRSHKMTAANLSATSAGWLAIFPLWGGGSVSVANKLTKSVTAWSDVKIPEGISKTFFQPPVLRHKWRRAITPQRDGMRTGGKAIAASWNILSQVKNDKYAEYCKGLKQSRPGALAREYGNFTDNVVKESLELVFSKLGGHASGIRTPAGACFFILWTWPTPLWRPISRQPKLRSRPGIMRLPQCG